MSDNYSSTTGIIVIGALTALNTGLFIHLYRRYKDIENTVLKLETEKKKEKTTNIYLHSKVRDYAKPESINSIRRSIRAIQASSTVSDSEYQDAVEQTWENRSIESKTFNRFAEEETRNHFSENNLIPVKMVNKSPSYTNYLNFERLDKLYEDGFSEELYDELIILNNEGWIEGWSSTSVASRPNDTNQKKKEFLEEGHNNMYLTIIHQSYKHAVIAYEKEPEEFNVIKWYAACTGGRTDFLGTADKIKQGHKFKELIDKALSKSPNDYALLYMRGRFAFSVSGLSWFERKAAATLFAEPPKATYDEAINDFLAVYKLKPEWIENLVFLAKCYLAKKEKDEAVKYLKIAVENTGTEEWGSLIGEKAASKSDNNEEDLDLKEAKELLKKYK
ncbi:TPR_REGION domain-containing protein [Meloidogyne graminicola]|uniref:TPR_REGION domain-containing protein n=1 Tax=Meloidogyne graminicola TaxID=189291 RepID=A0A8S9ZLW2_9BILA|nr:TPR_REGION domain-containing protein [Meloidogyne graminicola]